MNSLTIQYIIVGIIVLAAAIYLFKEIQKAAKGKKSCNKGCGCELDNRSKKSNAH